MYCPASFSCRKRQQRMTRQGQNEKPVRSASLKGSIFLLLCYNKAETCSTGADKKKAQTPGAPGHNKKCAYRFHAGRIQIGICRAGGAAALAPRTCEGGVPALAQGRGEYEFPATEHQIELSFCVCHPLLFVSFYDRNVGDGLPPIPVCALVSPPSQVRGARPRTASGHKPLPKQPDKFPI